MGRHNTLRLPPHKTPNESETLAEAVAKLRAVKAPERMPPRPESNWLYSTWMP